MKPVIIHIVQHLKPGGIESFALEFQRAAKPLFEVHIVSLEKQNVTDYWNNIDGVNEYIHILDKKPGWRLDIVYELKTLFEKIKPVYVHTHHIGPLIYGGIAAKLANIKHVVHTEHDAWHLENKKSRFLQRIILNYVKPVYVADADFVAEQVKKLIPSLNPYVIANGIDTKKFIPSIKSKKESLEKFGLSSKLKYIGCAARLESVKGHDVLIKALHNLPVNIGLLLAGTGSLEKKLKKLVSKLGLEKRVYFLGHIDDMTNFYPLIDVFCLSSHNEGLPLSPLEAQACGIPVVLTDVGGCKEAICNKTGIVVQPNNPILLSQALNTLINKKSKYSPRLFIENERSIDNMIEQYLFISKSDIKVNHVG